MVITSEVVSITDLSENASGVLSRLNDSDNPLVVTQQGEPAAVLLSLEGYERREREREILILLARGEQEIAAGIGRDYKDVLAEARAIIDAP